MRGWLILFLIVGSAVGAMALFRRASPAPKFVVENRPIEYVETPQARKETAARGPEPRGDARQSPPPAPAANPPESAILALERTLEANPEDRRSLAQLLSLYRDRGDFARGNRMLEKLNSGSTASPEVALNVGHFLTEQRRFEETIPHFEKAAEQPELRATALFALAKAHEQMGNAPESVRALEGLVSTLENEVKPLQARGQVRPEHILEIEEGKLELAAALIANQDFEKAKLVLDGVSRALPGNPHVESLRRQMD